MEGIKYDDGKPRFDLLPASPLVDVAAVAAYGAKKYSDRNWEKGMPYGRIYAALQRHLWAFWNGEDNDKESGLPHMAHAAWGCLALLEMMQKRKDLDDRPTTRTTPDAG